MHDRLNRRLIALLLAVTLVLSLGLLGCGEEQVAEVSSTTTTTLTTTTTSTTEAPTTTTTAKPAALPWSEAMNHVGEHMTVEGPVMGTHYASSSNGQPTFLNIGRDYPDPDRFAVVIWGQDRGNFSTPPENAY